MGRDPNGIVDFCKKTNVFAQLSLCGVGTDPNETLTKAWGQTPEGVGTDPQT